MYPVNVSTPAKQSTTQTTDKPQPALTLEQAKALKYGDVVYYRRYRNADGTASRWCVNGRVKTWKRNPSRVSVPIKWGLKTYDTLTENELDLVSLEDCR